MTPFLNFLVHFRTKMTINITTQQVAPKRTSSGSKMHLLILPITNVKIKPMTRYISTTSKLVTFTYLVSTLSPLNSFGKPNFTHITNYNTFHAISQFFETINHICPPMQTFCLPNIL